MSFPETYYVFIEAGMRRVRAKTPDMLALFMSSCCLDGKSFEVLEIVLRVKRNVIEVPR